MTQPKISIVICTFNRGKHFLPRAIKSVLNQTYKNWELLIADDCSTDDTEKVVRQFSKKNKRIIYYKTKKQSGGYLGVPRNEIMKAATGDWLAFLDSDNAYRKDHLQVLYKAMEKVADNDNYAGVYGDRLIVDETGERPSVPGICGEWSVRRLLFQNYIDTSDVLIKRSVFEAVGGWDESLRKFADWNLWTRIGKAGYKMVRVPIIITDYYVHEGMNQLATNLTIKDLFDPMNCHIWPVKTIYGKEPELKVAIYTLVKDRLEYTKKTFKTMEKLAGYPFSHYVVDNGSGKETAEWLKEHIGTSKYAKYLIRNKKNVGISKGSNQALDKIGDKYDLIMKVDNDCAFKTKDWLKRIVECYNIVRTYALSPYVEGLIDHPGGVPRTRIDGANLPPYGHIGKELVGFVQHLGGISIIAPSKVYKNFRWKENDFYHGIQDLEFSRHCLNSGYALSYLENIKVEHIDSEIGQRKKYKDYFKEKDEVLKTTKYA